MPGERPQLSVKHVEREAALVGLHVGNRPVDRADLRVAWSGVEELDREGDEKNEERNNTHAAYIDELFIRPQTRL